MKPFDTFVNIATTSSSVTLSVTSMGLIAMPVSIGIASALKISDKVLREIVGQKYNYL